MPPNPHPDFVPSAQDEAVEWRYTTEKPADGWAAPGFDDSGWKTGPAPFGHQFPGGSRTDWTTADLWIRRHATLSESIPAHLAFNVFHDEDVEIYLNGILAAAATGYTKEYVKLPVGDEARAGLKPGDCVIAAHVRQTIGGQGIDLGIVAAAAP